MNPDLVGGLGTAFGQVFSYNYGGYSVGVSVQIPLRNRAAQADNARAATEKRISENRLTAQAQQIALEVRNALTMVDMNKARIDAATTARTLAERRLEAEQKKFDLGASTIRFVLEEQRNLAQAQTDELQSLVNYTRPRGLRSRHRATAQERQHEIEDTESQRHREVKQNKQEGNKGLKSQRPGLCVLTFLQL